MELGVQVVILVICGAIAAAIASSKGRNVVGWFFGGFFLGFIGVIIVAVLPNLKAQREKELHAERENRRLREQLRQERMKAEAFRQHTASRLDTHDEHLGLDTRTANQLLLEGQTNTPPQLGADPAAALGQLDGGGDGQWYYELNGQAVGPTSQNSIKQLLSHGRLNHASLVWTERLGDWTPAGSLPEFQGAAS